MNKLATRSHHPLPMYSHISAGPPCEVVEDFHLVDISELVTHGREGYVVAEVTGDSMSTSIPSGSMIFIDTWAEPRNGSIIAASINGNVCVKEFRVRERRLYLVPRNHSYPVREVTESDFFHVIGVIKGCLSLFGA